MSKEDLLYIPLTITKNVLKYYDVPFKKIIEELAISSSKYDLEDMSADSENVKVEYPIKIKFQEDGTAECQVPIRVSYKETKGN